MAVFSGTNSARQTGKRGKDRGNEGTKEASLVNGGLFLSPPLVSASPLINNGGAIADKW